MAGRLKGLEDANRKLKKLLAESMLDNAERRRFGYRRLFILLRREGEASEAGPVNTPIFRAVLGK